MHCRPLLANTSMYPFAVFIVITLLSLFYMLLTWKSTRPNMYLSLALTAFIIGIILWFLGQSCQEGWAWIVLVLPFFITPFL